MQEWDQVQWVRRILRNKVKKAELDVAVTNMAISNLPADAEVVITHKDLTERAQKQSTKCTPYFS